MTPDSPLAIVQAWQDAANDQNVERLLALSAPDIEIVGPRGSGYGHQLLRDWLARAGLTLTTLRAFVSGADVVLADYGLWRYVDSGEVNGEAEIACRFRVADGRVALFARYDDLDDALAAAHLTPADEIPLGA